MQSLFRRRWIAPAHTRLFADRGLNRKDYTDPGFQALGYINAGWFANTHEGRFKGPLPRDPVYAGINEDEETFRMKMKKKKKMGEARKQYEASTKQEEQSPVKVEVRGFNDNVCTSKSFVKPPKVAFEDEIIPEMEMVNELKKVKKVKVKQKVLRGFKGRILTDYADYGYNGSGLDEYSNKVEEKKRKQVEELVSMCENNRNL